MNQISGTVLHRVNEQTKKDEYTFQLSIVEPDMTTVVAGPFQSPLIFSSDQEAAEAMDLKVREVLAQAGLRLHKSTIFDRAGNLVSVNDMREYDA